MDAVNIAPDLAPAQVRNELTPEVREGFRTVAKVIIAIGAVAAVAIAAVATIVLIPQTATIVAAIGTLSLASQIAILAGSIVAAALAIFGIEQLGRESALDSSEKVDQQGLDECLPPPPNLDLNDPEII